MKQLAWAVILLTAAVPGRADAECGVPRWFGAADASPLPARGSIFLHHEGMMRFEESIDRLPQPVIRWIGAASPITVHKVSDVVLRIDYDAPHAFGAELKSDPDDYYDATHVRIDPRWTAPARAPHVVQYWHDIYSWTCSSSNSVNIQLDQAVAAVRVRWTHGGTTREWIEAPRSTEPTKSVLEIGKINCGSTTVDPEELAAGGHLELIAIRADRSEVPITGLPDILSTKLMPSDERDRTMHLATMLPEVPAVAPTTTTTTTTPGNGVGVIVLGILALGILLAIRYRVRAPSSVP